MIKNDRLTWWYWRIVADRTTERTLQKNERKKKRELDHRWQVTNLDTGGKADRLNWMDT